LKADQSLVQLPDTILGIKLTEKEKALLLSGKETALIKGFTNKEGHVFDAFLSLNGENKLVFRFESVPVELAKVSDNEYDAYKSQINLAEFALSYGFSTEKDFATTALISGYILLQNEANVEIIVFRDNSSLEYRYFTLGQPGEALTIIEFISTFLSPLVDDIKNEVQKFYKRPQSKLQKIKLEPVTVDFMDAFNSVFELSNLTNREYFYDNDIKDATLDHAFFRGTIVNKKTNGRLVPCYPLTRGEQLSEVYSVEVENREPVDATEQKEQDSVWLSNVINNQKIRRLVLVYDPLDALAYHQLHSRPSDLFSMFISTCGDTNIRQLKVIQEIIDRLRPEQVVLAGARDEAGIFNNILVLGHLSEPRHYLKENNAWQDESAEIRFNLQLLPKRNNAYAALTVKLTYPDLEKGIFMNENLQKYFDHINSKELNGHADWEGQNPFNTSILSIGKHSSTAEIIFPYRVDLLGITEKIISHLRPLLFFKTEFPRLHSYREDLQLATESKQAAKETKSKKAS